MTKEITAISKQMILGKEFEIYGDFENPLFLAKDVAEIIEHSDTSKMVSKIDEDEKTVRTMFVSGQNRDCLFLTENGLYEVLMLSRKPVSKQFKKAIKELLYNLRTNKMVITFQKSKEEIENERKELNIEAYNALLPLPKTEKPYSPCDIAKELKFKLLDTMKKVLINLKDC